MEPTQNVKISEFFQLLPMFKYVIPLLTLGLSSAPNVHFGAVFCAEHDAAKNF